MTGGAPRIRNIHPLICRAGGIFVYCNRFQLFDIFVWNYRKCWNVCCFVLGYSCTISKTGASVSSGFPNTRKLMKARGRRPNAFIVFECLETLMKHDALVFEVASQSRLRNKRKWKYSRIFRMLSASFLLREIVLLWWFAFSERVSPMLSQCCGW